MQSMVETEDAVKEVPCLQHNCTHLVLGVILIAVVAPIKMIYMEFCRELVSPSQMTTATSITRIVANRQQYEARNAKKVKAENKYYSSQKEYVQEG